jgi:hypothetical protein
MRIEFEMIVAWELWRVTPAGLRIGLVYSDKVEIFIQEN